MENILKDQNIEDKVDEQQCKTCKEVKHISKFYKRINKKTEIHCRSCRNKQRDKLHRDVKQQFINYQSILT